MEYIFGVILTCLITFFFYNNFKNRKKKENVERFTEFEFEWNPKPLVDERILVGKKSKQPHVVNGMVAKYVEVDGKKLLNFVSHNYLSLIENETIKERAKQAIYKYGVGSCGPRGFYGTVDVHLDLESRLAKFMGTESAIVYSYGFTTIASAIAAYAKKNDVVFVDEKVNFAIQRGMEAARCHVLYFKHNDVTDLERLLNSYESERIKNGNKKRENRKFLIAEGIYLSTGKICPLLELIRVRNKYKMRMFLDESVSFGVLGRSSRGVVEYFNADIEEVDMIMASMEYALGTGGGFCVGSSFVIEHQRLSGQGYCFSASLPPFLAVAAYAGIDMIEKDNYNLSRTLQQRCRMMHNALHGSVILENIFTMESDVESPVKHLVLKISRNDDWNILDSIVDHCKSNGVMITTAHYLMDKEHVPPPASIRLTVSVLMESKEIALLIQLLEQASEHLLYK